MNDTIVDVSTKINIYVQLAVGISNIFGLSTTLPEKDMVLKDILILETIVQIIEFLWYVLVIQYLPQEEMAKNRYYDWVFSTPLMLISMFSYLLYEEQLEKTPDAAPIRLSTIFKNHTESIIRIVLSNLCMLLIGYLYEQGQLSRSVAFTYGFIFLVNTFSIIYMNAGIKSSKGQLVFWIMFLVWNIYGIAFLLPTAIKNTTFNIVDLFSKNFFELYISMLVFNKRI